jgi:hypothetical protein
MPETVPTAEEFRSGCGESFSFLGERGFTAERTGEFEVLYSGPYFSVRVTGEGYGTEATVTFAVQSGAEVPLALLIPSASRSAPPAGQLPQIAFYAHQVQAHCQDVLSGDVRRLDRAEAEWTRIKNRGSAA